MSTDDTVTVSLITPETLRIGQPERVILKLETRCACGDVHGITVNLSRAAAVVFPNYILRVQDQALHHLVALIRAPHDGYPFFYLEPRRMLAAGTGQTNNVLV